MAEAFYVTVFDVPRHLELRILNTHHHGHTWGKQREIAQVQSSNPEQLRGNISASTAASIKAKARAKLKSK